MIKRYTIGGDEMPDGTLDTLLFLAGIGLIANFGSLINTLGPAWTFVFASLIPVIYFAEKHFERKGVAKSKGDAG